MLEEKYNENGKRNIRKIELLLEEGIQMRNFGWILKNKYWKEMLYRLEKIVNGLSSLFSMIKEVKISYK
jgi:hypothetical protein